MAFGDRRTPLKRTGFTSKAPVNPARKVAYPVKPKRPIKPSGRRRLKELREYDKLRAELLPPDVVHPCEAGGPLFKQDVWGCTLVATELHHRRKRSAAGALANPANVVRTCHHCNVYGIEDHPEAAERAGLVVREGNPEWDALSARAWRERA